MSIKTNIVLLFSIHDRVDIIVRRMTSASPPRLPGTAVSSKRSAEESRQRITRDGFIREPRGGHY